jgi:hypothetical protein
MDTRAKEIVKIGNNLFDKKKVVDSLWQEIALNFYPERADFTTEHSAGDEFAGHLYSSYPVMARRELGNVLSSYLYSRSQKRFSIHVADEELDKGENERKFLEYLTDIQWRAMYDSPAMLARATKQSAHDFASFGNAVLKFGLNVAGDGLLFNNYHLKDNAWTENGEGKIDCNHRNWEPTARQLEHHFRKTISSDVRKAATKDPEKTFKCRHVVLPSRIYQLEGKGKQFPYVSLYVECESETVLEEIGLNYFCYVIPRWQTIAGSQYAVSMATSIMLPDGRTTQAVVHTLREAGEKYVRPPMIAVTDAIRGDIALYAGGVTSVDIEYDEKTGEVLRPITQDKGGVPVGFDIAISLKEDIRSGFFLDKIQLPETGKDMTAFEVRRRVEEHIRAQTPIFDPIEEEYSPLYSGVFDLLKDNGAFPIQEMPESLENHDIRFSFFSPLADLADQREAETFVDVRDRILGPVAAFDPAQLEQVEWTTATRDAMRAAGFKAAWFKPKEAVAQRQDEMAKAAAMAKGAEALGAAGAIAEQGGKGAVALQEAGIA